MARKRKNTPKILVVTPEITYLPEGMSKDHLSAKAGGLADVSASLVSALYSMGADVHVAMPYYRRLFHLDTPSRHEKKRDVLQDKLSEERIHFAKDRIFFYRQRVYSGYYEESMRISLAFQREVINNIIPDLQPDLIHCNDWMTGLIPGFARRMGIPSLFTVHNIHTQKTTLENIENSGIDAADFWGNLYYERTPWCYEETRSTNSVDLLTSGIFSAHFINTVSPTFLKEIVESQHGFIPEHIHREIANKYYAGCATGILNSPDPEDSPEIDHNLAARYSWQDVVNKKRFNKLEFQEAVGLPQNPDAPLFFWPSRLDPMQKGPELLSDIMYSIIHDYWDQNIQVAFVANGAYQSVFQRICDMHDFHNHIAVVDFNDGLSHQGYAASDFILMPSRFEPCGLPQMIGPLYGALPIVHNTGGLHDSVQQLNVNNNTGNGFIFDYYDSQGLRWAIDQAMAFYNLPPHIRTPQIQRIMKESKSTFNHTITADAYIKIYEQMLERPLI